MVGSTVGATVSRDAHANQVGVGQGNALAEAEELLHGAANDPAKAASLLMEVVETCPQSRLAWARYITALQWSGAEQKAAEAARRAAESGVFPSMYQRPVHVDTRIPELGAFPLYSERYPHVQSAIEAIESWVSVHRVAMLNEMELAERLKLESDDAHGENLAERTATEPSAQDKLSDNAAGHRSGWSHFVLSELYTEDALCEFPKTATLVNMLIHEYRLPVLRARFSTISPGTCIRRHCGPTNRRWTIHAALKVDEEDEGLVSLLCHEELRHVRTGGLNELKRNRQAMLQYITDSYSPANQRIEIKYSWKQGGVILFDDSYEHRVDHRGRNTRSVLHIDFVHPALFECH
eukprot:scaffold1033_cov408-Prasinococcus_capsulatus_cf.AAC.33